MPGKAKGKNNKEEKRKMRKEWGKVAEGEEIGWGRH